MPPIRKLFLIPISAILFYSCANQSQPTGGPKDEEAPKLISSEPEEREVNYKEKTIILTFDEDIVVSSPKDQLIITPKIDEPYDIKYRKNEVRLTLNEALLENTTYTFNFRESVKDITEGNVPSNLKLTFSTGPYIDSLEIKGKISSLLTEEPLQNSIIALYEANDTLDVFNSPPLYLAQTEGEGEYLIENIKKGKYLLYSFIDENKNLKLEVNSEKYGFYPDTINLDSTIHDINIPLQSLDISEFKLQNARPSGHYYIIKFNKFIKEYSIKSENDSTIYSQTYNNNKTIRIYNTFPIKDSIALYLQAEDSTQQLLKDTVYLSFEKTKRKKEAFQSKVKETTLNLVQQHLKASLSFSKPVLHIKSDSILLQMDSSYSIQLNAHKGFKWKERNTVLEIDTILNKATFEKRTNPDSSSQTIPQLLFGKGTFTSADREGSKKIVTPVQEISTEDFGTLKADIITKEKSYIIQLINRGSQEIEYESINPKKLTIDNLKPDTYWIRILIDTNANGKWDPGNLYQRIAPEQVKIYQNESGQKDIIIRANWELSDIKIKF